MRRLIVLAVALVLWLGGMAPAFAHPLEPGSPVGPPGGTFWVNDEQWQSAVTPAHLPNNLPLSHYDAFYILPDCPTCAPVAANAPGDVGYKGGRWAVIQATGITSQLTNAGAVTAAATSLVDTGHRFECPLIRVG